MSEAGANISNEYSDGIQLANIRRIAAQDETLIGQTVLIRPLPALLSALCPDADREITHLLEYFGHHEGLGLTIDGFDRRSGLDYSGVMLTACVGKPGPVSLNWNALLLGIFGTPLDP